MKLKVLKVGMALALAGTFSSGCAWLISRPLWLPEQSLFPAEAIVVLGYGPPKDQAGRPKPELKRRVEQGVELYRRGLAPVLVMTGGKTGLTDYEADVMRDLARELKVPESAILLEREAIDTISNARGSIDLLCKGKTDPACLPSIILVSSVYHLRRAKKLFECGGAKVQTSAGALPEHEGVRIVFALHEYQVGFEYLWIDECAKVRGGKGER